MQRSIQVLTASDSDAFHAVTLSQGAKIEVRQLHAGQDADVEVPAEFFERADLMDTKLGTEKKQAASEVAKLGFDAMMRGEGDVITGWSNKLRAAIANFIPSETLAEQQRKVAEPGSASRS